MNKNFILGVMGSIFFLGIILWISYPKGNENNAGKNYPNPSGQVALAADHKTFDFGSISMKKGKVTHTFTFKNEEASPITLTKAYTSCMCTVANIKVNGKSFGPYGMVGMSVSGLGEVLQPGAEAQVEVIFDPAAHGPAGVGDITREVTVENNAGNPIAFTFSASVTP